MLPQEVIRRKRDGGELAAAEIEQFVAGLVNGAVSEGQAAALAMAIYFNGMVLAERVALTLAMTRSGVVLSWDDLDGPVVDKHSTGGVGDTVSLMLAPAVAACGAFVPMISGRGLGHTGGTLDKMGSIPGYDAVPARETFRRVVRDVGCAIIGQTDDLAPADKRLYAIRDVTATVESVPLITASILSKKLAAGLDGLAMDVKFGNGAFMASRQDAQELADALVEVAVGAGLPTRAVLTDMNQPLASAAGNAVEVVYAIDYLTGARREPRMHDVVVTLGAEMLVLASLATDAADGRTKIERALDGAATEKFAAMVTALGGPEDLVEFPGRHLERADVEVAVTPEHPGRVSAIDTRAVGLAVVTLGGGRTRPQDPVDPAVGLTQLAEIDADVGADRPLAIVHARNAEQLELATQQVRAAYTVHA
ncbi:MAG TPA: thymidine phosphorylase [Ilumatobacteraceae bacterium]|nr:thymidine phosphorylase [Ilumatobacteraceae bacterium]